MIWVIKHRFKLPWLPISESSILPLLDSLHPQEKNFFLAQRTSKRAHQFALGRIAARYLVSQIKRVQNKDIIISLPNNAAPVLTVCGIPWHLSISHSHEAVMVAVSPKCTVGVDIQYTNKKRDVSRLSREFAAFSDCTDKNFYSRWVLLEALAKKKRLPLLTLLNSPFLLDEEFVLMHSHEDSYSWALVADQSGEVHELSLAPLITPILFTAN